MEENLSKDIQISDSGICTKQGKVTIISVENLKPTIRIMIEINGFLFKRLSHPMYPPTWNDEHGTFSDCLAMTKEQERELESIFIAYVSRNSEEFSKLLKK